MKIRTLAILIIAVAIVIALVGRIDIPAAHYGDPDRAVSGVGATLPVIEGFKDSDWPGFGRDTGGSQFSPLSQITPANVSGLKEAWVHHSGDVHEGTGLIGTSLEVSPVVVGDILYYCTPFGRVFALDAATGKERWNFDPFHGVNGKAALFPVKMQQGICRSVAYWKATNPAPGQKCESRIFRSAADTTVFAIDATTGEVCTDFGADYGHPGFVRHKDFENHGEGAVTASSPPLVIGDVLIAALQSYDGLSNSADGIVRGFDVRSGKMLWEFDPIPEDKRDITGAGNVWTILSGDPARRLAFLATTSPSTDYYGGERKFDMPLVSSIVAVSVDTGEVKWHYQTVHHDLFDYDLPATPQLVTIRKDGKDRDVVIEQTKMGTVFVLDRDTGEPVFPVVERPVPKSYVAGEEAAPTQPVPVLPEAFAHRSLGPDDLFGLTRLDRAWCRARLSKVHNDGPYTPPAPDGALEFPSSLGGGNWGGSAYDPKTNLLIVKAENLASLIALKPQNGSQAAPDRPVDYMTRPLQGTPYRVEGEVFLSPLGIPCTPPPWGALSAIDMDSGKIVWQVALGQSRRFGINVPEFLNWGSPNVGGPIATGGGLIFIGATFDKKIRAIDIRTGRELWSGQLPQPGMAVPTTYSVGGRQFVVIAGGGNALASTDVSDALVAFALPQP
jgi:quinoprotein glucose dehydrogenase